MITIKSFDDCRKALLELEGKISNIKKNYIAVKKLVSSANEFVIGIGVDGKITTGPAFESKQANANPWIGVPVTTRAAGAIYQNTGTLPMTVAITVTVAVNNSNSFILVFCDANSSPVTEVGRVMIGSTGNVTHQGTATFKVLPGYYYKYTATGSVTQLDFLEWR